METPRFTTSDRGALIKEKFDRQEAFEGVKGPGCLPPDTPYSAQPGIIRATDIIEPIPRSLWPQLIAAGEGTWLRDMIRPRLPAHNQGRTNYCWAHAAVRALEALNLFHTNEPKTLSAESVAVPLTNGRNVGGWPEEALKRLISHGACFQNLWPLNSLSTSHYTPAVAEDAKNHRVIRWAYLDGFNMQMTFSLLRLPVILPLSWWGHAVCQTAPHQNDDGSFGAGIDNSWGDDWGDKGYAILDEAEATAEHGAIAPITCTMPIEA